MTLLKKSALLILGLSVSVFAGDVCEGMFNAGDYKRAGDCYVGQLKKNKSLENYFWAGVSFERQGKFKEALTHLKEAEKRANRSGDFRLIYNNLSAVYGNLGDKKSELAYNMKTLDIDIKNDNNQNLGTDYSNLGVYYANMDDDNKAIEYYTKALNFFEDNEKAVTYANMAVSYAHIKDTAKAEEYYQKAIEIEINQGDYLSLCGTKKNLGIFYKNQNRFDEALALLSDAKDICHKAGNISKEAHALGWVAYLYYKQGDTATANQYINQAIPLAKQSGDIVVLQEVAYDYKVIMGQIKE